MYYRRLSDREIIKGFREGNSDIIRYYFYGYCEVGYNIFDERYKLREKQNQLLCRIFASTLTSTLKCRKLCLTLVRHTKVSLWNLQHLMQDYQLIRW